MHYSRQPTYLAPEISYFNTVKDSSKKDINVKVYPESRIVHQFCDYHCPYFSQMMHTTS